MNPMDNTPTRPGALLEEGVVRGLRDDGWMIDAESGPVLACRAVSCLVEPKAGDAILLARRRNGCAHILHVLDREEAGTALVFEGDVSLTARGGAVRVTGETEVFFASRERIETNAPATALRGGRIDVCYDEIHAAAGSLEACVGRMQVVARALDSVIDNISQYAKRLFRRVEEEEEVRAKRVHVAADEWLDLRAPVAHIKGKTLVKIDGDQIQMG